MFATRMVWKASALITPLTGKRRNKTHKKTTKCRCTVFGFVLQTDPNPLNILFFPARSCKSIIMGSAPGVGDHHGCPFRHFSAPNLRAKLASKQVDEFDTEDILGLVSAKHYQIACTRYYEVTRARMIGGSPDTLRGGSGSALAGGGEFKVASQEQIEHPNQFFEQSYKLMQQHKSTTGGTGDQEMETPLDPTIKGRYTYKKIGGPSSIANNDMEM